MNTASCHRAPRIPESYSFCLFIHYVVCFSNKVAFLPQIKGWHVCGRIWMVALSRATKVLALKGNGPTHMLTDPKGWLTNTPGRVAMGSECRCVWMPSLLSPVCFSAFLSYLYTPPSPFAKKKTAQKFKLRQTWWFLLSAHFSPRNTSLMLADGAASINLNKFPWCGPYIFSAWTSPPPSASVHSSCSSSDGGTSRAQSPTKRGGLFYRAI